MKNAKMLFSICVLMILCICLVGCGKSETVEEAEESSEDPYITVTLTTDSLQGHASKEYILEEGQQLDEAAAYETEGCYWNWFLEDGTLVDPFLYVYTEDTKISGECIPYVNIFTPFLSVREDGWLHGEELLTMEELDAALDIWIENEDYLAEAVAAADSAPEADGAVTAENVDVKGVSPATLRSALEILPEIPAQLEAVLEDMGLTDSSEALDRNTFAKIMVETLGIRQYQVSFEELGKMPLDLDADNAAMLLATQYYMIPVVEGTALLSDGSEDAVKEAFLSAVWPEGYTFLNARLYYADETGSLLRDGRIGIHLYFGPDGKQTIGDEELDFYVAQHLMGYMREYPEMNRYEWLNEAFYDVVWNVIYYPQSHPKFGDNCNEEWLYEFAKEGLGMGTGDCYGSGASFTALARALGYDAHAISGFAFTDYDAHSWSIIKIDPEHPLDIFPGENAKDYFYDPQMEAHKLIGGTITNFGKIMFELDPVNSDWWRYQWYRPATTCKLEEEAQ